MGISFFLEHHFDCSHQLRLSKGQEPLHSHRWRLKLYFAPLKKNQIFESIIFNNVKAYIKEIINPLEGKPITSCSYFKKINPSTENIAHFIFSKLEDLSTISGYRPLKVSLWETEDFCASWIRE